MTFKYLRGCTVWTKGSGLPVVWGGGSVFDLSLAICSVGTTVKQHWTTFKGRFSNGISLVRFAKFFFGFDHTDGWGSAVSRSAQRWGVMTSRLLSRSSCNAEVGRFLEEAWSGFWLEGVQTMLAILWRSLACLRGQRSMSIRFSVVPLVWIKHSYELWLSFYSRKWISRSREALMEIWSVFLWSNA